MENQYRTRRQKSHRPTFPAVETSRRRLILSALLERSTAMSVQALALALAEREQDDPETDVPSQKTRAIRTNLRHVQLPLLEDSGLIDWNREEETILTTDHAAFEDARFRRLLETDVDGLDDALSGLSNERRRHLLAILRDDRTAKSKRTLARAVLQREKSETEPDRAAIDTTVLSLSHVHLPRLIDANIIEYDAETGQISYTEHRGLETVFALFHKPNSVFVDRLDEFLGGLLTTYTNLGGSADDPFAWPASWRDAHHG